MWLFGDRSKIEQHIAVFGESGSGKTTLLSVFFGYQQAPEFAKSAGYKLHAKDSTQSTKLLNAYYSLENQRLPPATRYQGSEFVFYVTPSEDRKHVAKIVWHDYPGEWWTETKKGEEARRKRATFKKLLCSDLAFFLIDGEKFKDKGAPYVAYLFDKFRDEIHRQITDILREGDRL